MAVTPHLSGLSPRAWRILWVGGLLLALVVVVVCLLPSRNLPSTGINDKFEHALAFAALALWFGGLAARRDHLFVLLALVALGGGIEIAQGLMGLGRMADVRDLLADLLGALGGVALAYTPLGRWPRLLERGLRWVTAPPGP